MNPAHRLLRRQLRKHFGDTLPDVPGLAAFVNAVDQAYEQQDVHRLVVERAMNLSSVELSEAMQGIQAQHALEQRARQETLRAKDEADRLNRLLAESLERARHLTREAEAADAAKSRFLANMSHELRTPLNTINALSATLAEQDGPPDVRHAARLILRCGESLLENIQTILTHSSLEAGGAKLDLKPFQLGGVLLNALNIAGQPARRKNIALDYHVDAGTPAEVVGDPFRLQQILVNLLANALKFTESGRVYLRVRSRPAADGACELRFAIADTGIGISRENLQRLFQPFSRAEDAGQRRYEGTGLGLAITKSLIELMGGRITVASRVGVGSLFRFTITLPAVPASPRLLTVGARPELVGRRVLLCEPDPLRRRLLLALAQAWQLDATTTETPLPADARFDLLVCSAPLSDASLDRLAGLELTTLPIVWLVPPGTFPILPRHGRSRLVYVPFAPPDLSDALTTLLRAEPTLLPVAVPVPRHALGERLPLRILSADDQETNREVVETLCRHLGYQPDSVTNGAEVLEALERAHYDLVLLDAQMPVLDGLAAARLICQRQPDRARRPRLVALTANASPADRDACLAAGMDDFLSKPILPQQLHDCIERLFGERAAAGPEASPAALAAAPTEHAELVDLGHLRRLTAGFTAGETFELLHNLYDAARIDFSSVHARMVTACTARDPAALMACLHGLKGCALSLGCRRLAHYCSDLQAASSNAGFAGWSEVPRDVLALWTASAAEWEQLLAAALIATRETAPA